MGPSSLRVVRIVVRILTIACAISFSTARTCSISAWTTRPSIDIFTRGAKFSGGRFQHLQLRRDDSRHSNPHKQPSAYSPTGHPRRFPPNCQRRLYYIFQRHYLRLLRPRHPLQHHHRRHPPLKRKRPTSLKPRNFLPHGPRPSHTREPRKTGTGFLRQVLGEERFRHGAGRHPRRTSCLSLSPLLDAAGHTGPIKECMFDGTPAFQSVQAR